MFGLFSSDGCDGGHLWGEWNESDAVEVREDGWIHVDENGDEVDWEESVEFLQVFEVMKRKHRFCRFSDCYERDKMWSRIGTVREDELLELAREEEE